MARTRYASAVESVEFSTGTRCAYAAALFRVVGVIVIVATALTRPAVEGDVYECEGRECMDDYVDLFTANCDGGGGGARGGGAEDEKYLIRNSKGNFTCDEVLQHRWDRRVAMRTGLLWGEALEALSFFFTLPLVFCVLNALRAQKHSVSTLVAPAFMLASSLMIAELTFSAGEASFTDWEAGWTNGKGKVISFDAKRGLEQAHMVQRSHFVWLFSVEWFLISVGVIALGVLSVREPGVLGPRWALCSYTIGALGFLRVVIDGMRYEGWQRYSMVGSIVLLVDGVVLFPLWLVWSGRALANVKQPRSLNEGIDGDEEDASGIL